MNRFTLVGENRFTSVRPFGVFLIRETPTPSDFITVEPRDVLGYFATINNFNESVEKAGIQLHSDYREEVVWYSNETGPSELQSTRRVGPDRVFSSMVTLAPVITASVGKLISRTSI